MNMSKHIEKLRVRLYSEAFCKMEPGEDKDDVEQVLNIEKELTPEEYTTVLEIARVALSDVDIANSVGYSTDLTDADMSQLREKLEKVMNPA